jgi:hypothetical protein
MDRGYVSSSVEGMTDAARAILRDSFTRLIEHVDELTNDLSDEVAF